MNELKPEDVMRALEHCADYKSAEVSCVGCPIYGRCFDEPNLLEISALALLREKDAEIERLKDEYEIKCETRFGKITIPKMRSLGEGAELIYKEIRAEAITEFAERIGKALTAQVNASSNEMLAAFMWCLDLVKNVEKQLKGATDGESDD